MPQRKFAIAAYLNVPVYADFHRWLGRGRGAAADVGRMAGGRPQGGAGRDSGLRWWTSWSCTGRPPTVGRKIQRYFDNGVTTTSLAIMPFDPELKHWDAVRVVAPLRLNRRSGRGHAARRSDDGERRAALAANWRRISAMWASPRSRVRRSRRNCTGSSDGASKESCIGRRVVVAVRVAMPAR